MTTHDTATTKGKIAVMEAADARKEIESADKNNGDWSVNKNPSWDWLHYDYRVKPEPLVCWGNVDCHGKVSIFPPEEESCARSHIPGSTFTLTRYILTPDPTFTPEVIK